MPIADDIRVLADRTHKELDGVHDFFQHSQIIWDAFQTLVASGHKLTSQNLSTGTTVTQDDLVQLEPKYVREYLTLFTFRQFLSIFENFFFDLFRLVLQFNPWQLTEKQLSFATVLNARDRDEIIVEVVQRRLNEIRYERVKDWFGHLNKAFKLGCPTEEELEALAEIKATRDIQEHNAGVANEIYVSKSGKKARYPVGERVEIPDAYHLESWRLLKKVVNEVTTAALAKLGKP